MKILLSQNPLIHLLIRRAPRATFPDMGRLTDSHLPTIEVKTTKQFCLQLVVLLILIVLLSCCYTALLNISPYRI